MGFILFVLFFIVVFFVWHIAIPWCIYMDKAIDRCNYTKDRMKEAICKYNLDKPAHYHSIPYVSFVLFSICAIFAGPFSAMIAAMITVMWMLVIGIVIGCAFVNIVRFAKYQQWGADITPRTLLEKYRSRKGK